MDQLEFIKANSENELKLIQQLADIIWREHYIPIIGLAQVEYMLNKYQSVKSMKNQLKENVFYYLIKYNEKPVGYLSFRKEKDALFLSKIYLLNNLRGKKIGKKALFFIENQAKLLKLPRIYLTVNKHNINAIQAYEKLEFKNIKSLVTDIGNGFVMDDFMMEKILP